jgi:DNA-binding SARP family transcriptional activator/tetratricopeptide (TPR) repeat protein
VSPTIPDIHQPDLKSHAESTLECCLEIRVLGECSARVVHGPPARLTRKQLGLLAYLGVNRRPFTRDHIAELLWPRVSLAKARQSLSQAIYEIRRVCPIEVLETQGPLICVQLQNVTVDVWTLNTALDSENVELLLKADAGRFMEGFGLPDSIAFDDWQAHVAGTLDARLAAAFNAGVQHLYDSGNWPLLEAVCEHLLARRRLNGDYAARYMHCLIAQGKYDAAGLFLGRATTDGTLNAEQVREFGQLITSAQSHNATDPPFVGRQAEFSKLRSVLAESTNGHARLCVLDGPVGVGKTRLAKQFLRYCAIRGCKVLMTTCQPGEETIPFEAWLRLLRDAANDTTLGKVPQEWLGPLSAILPGVGIRQARAEFGSLVESRAYVSEAVAQLLVHYSNAQPLVLFFDDCQWLPDSSLALCQYLLARLENEPLIIVLCVRTGNTLGRQRLQLRSSDVRISVPALPSEEASALVDTLANRDALHVAQTFRDSVVRVTGGVPLYIVEWVRSAKSSTVAHVPDKGGLPPSLEELVLERIRALPLLEFRLLELASVAGSSVSEHIVRAACGLARSKFVRAMDCLRDHGLLVDAEQTYSFSHEVVREVCHNQLSVARRRYYHARVAEALRKVGSEGEAAAIAYHFHASGDFRKGYVYAMKAADQARTRGAIDEAILNYSLARQCASSGHKRVETQRHIADLLAANGQLDEAAGVLLDLMEYFGSGRDRRQYLRAAISLASVNFRLGKEPTDQALARFEAFANEAEATEDPALEMHALLPLSLSVLDCGSTSAAERLILRLRRRIANYREAPEAGTCLHYLVSVSAAYFSAEDVLELAKEAARVQSTSSPPRAQYHAHCSAATAYLVTGDLANAEVHYRKALELIYAFQFWSARSGLLNNLAVLFIESGRYQEALELIGEAEQVARAAGAKRILGPLLGNKAIVFLELSRNAELAQVGSELLNEIDEFGPWWSRVAGLFSLGMAALARRDYPQATECAAELRNAVSSNRRTNDLSYAEIFIARVAEHEGDIAGAVARLEQRISEYQDRDIFCRYRLELERARLLMQSRPQEAVAAAGRIRDHAARMSAQPLVRKADAILDRLL